MKFEQVVKNAVEAIGRDGVIEANVRRERDHVLLEIIDNGEGLSDKNQDELFTPFFSSKSSGQGLGLTLVKEILLRHGTEFDLHTLNDGRTRFYILF